MDLAERGFKGLRQDQGGIHLNPKMIFNSLKKTGDKERIKPVQILQGRIFLNDHRPALYFGANRLNNIRHYLLAANAIHFN